MSECNNPCCATDVFVPNDFDYGTLDYATQGFSFVVNCPPGYYCQPGLFPRTVTIPKEDIPPVIVPDEGGPVYLQGCSSMITRTIPPNATAAQVNAIVLSMQQEWAQQQATCDVIIQFGLHKKAPLVILPVACLNSSYSVGSIPLPGTGPYVFTQTGALPPGLSFSQFSGTGIQIAGIPTQTGTFLFSVNDGTAAVNYQVSVMGLTNSPTAATKNSPYSFQFTVDGGVAPYIFVIVSGSLPTGLTMDASGLISGTPTVNGTFSFKVSFTDSSP